MTNLDVSVSNIAILVRVILNYETASWGFGGVLGLSLEVFGGLWAALGAVWGLSWGFPERCFLCFQGVLEAISHSLSVSEWFGIVLGTIFH